MTTPDTPKNFMSTMLPAAPGTYIVRKNHEATDGYTRTPVVAWAPQAENPYRAPYPITVMGLQRLLEGAILHPCGMVSSPNHVEAFATVEEWLAVAEEDSTTARRKGVDFSAIDREMEDDNAGLISDEDESYQIEWTTESFKSNSFWKYDDGEKEFLFAIEPGVNVPKRGKLVEKIKRDEFMSMKKTMDVLTVEQLMEGSTGSSASDEDDDDDGDDLI